MTHSVTMHQYHSPPRQAQQDIKEKKAKHLRPTNRFGSISGRQSTYIPDQYNRPGMEGGVTDQKFCRTAVMMSVSWLLCRVLAFRLKRQMQVRRNLAGVGLRRCIEILHSMAGTFNKCYATRTELHRCACNKLEACRHACEELRPPCLRRGTTCLRPILEVAM